MAPPATAKTPATTGDLAMAEPHAMARHADHGGVATPLGGAMPGHDDENGWTDSPLQALIDSYDEEPFTDTSTPSSSPPFAPNGTPSLHHPTPKGPVS